MLFLILQFMHLRLHRCDQLISVFCRLHEINFLRLQCLNVHLLLTDDSFGIFDLILI